MTPGSESATYQEYIDTYLAQHWPRKVLTSGADGLAVWRMPSGLPHTCNRLVVSVFVFVLYCICICIVLYLYLYVFGACPLYYHTHAIYQMHATVSFHRVSKTRPPYQFHQRDVAFQLKPF